jgi:hypothetical protein
MHRVSDKVWDYDAIDTVDFAITRSEADDNQLDLL